MFDPEQLLGQMLGGAIGNVFRGGSLPAFGTGSFRADTGMGLGLLGIAIAAFEHYNTPQAAAVSTPAAAALPPPPPKANTAPPPPPVSAVSNTRELPVLTEQQQNAIILIRAMIAAANADGTIDAAEREKIRNATAQSNLSSANQKFFEAELNAPCTLEQVLASKSSELTSDIYAASLAAIALDTAAERDYLDKLAAGLGLADSTRAQIHQKLGVTR